MCTKSPINEIFGFIIQKLYMIIATNHNFNADNFKFSK